MWGINFRTAFQKMQLLFSSQFLTWVQWHHAQTWVIEKWFFTPARLEAETKKLLILNIFHADVCLEIIMKIIILIDATEYEKLMCKILITIS